MVDIGYGRILIIIGVIQIASGNQNLCSNDPCTVNSLLTLSDIEGRSPVCSGGGGNRCDAYISAGWYKVNMSMSDKCPGLNNCGSIFPVWLNGSEPREVDGVVERNVCEVGPSNCCATTRSILIKKCSNFTAYCLKPLSSCPMGYCFGQAETCDNGTSTETDTNIPTTDTTTVTTTDKGFITLNNKYWMEKLHEKDVIIYTLGVIIAVVVILLIVVIIVRVCIHRRKSGTKDEPHQSFSNPTLNGIATNPYTEVNAHYTSIDSQVRNLSIGNDPVVNNSGNLNQETVQTPAQGVNSTAPAMQHYVNVQKGTTQEQTEKDNAYESLNEQTHLKEPAYQSLSETGQTVPKTLD